MKTITRTQFYQVIGLLALSANHYKAILAIEVALNETLGMPRDDRGFQSDAIWQGDTDADALLGHLNISVEPAPTDVTTSDPA